jgi:hypothetical protein
VKVEVNYNNAMDIAPLITFGILTVLYGVSIYYLMPLSLLSGNYGLILIIFFSILMGMVLGLTLLAYNLQSVVQIGLTHLFFFWEKDWMKDLIMKNFVAHKERNQLTSIIYSLTLGSMIFLVVSANLTLGLVENTEAYSNAAIVLRGPKNPVIKEIVYIDPA